MPFRILGGRPHVDHGRVAPVDQLNGLGRGNPSAATPDNRRPKQQPTRNEGDGDKNKVGVIGEKLHVGTAGLGVWKNERSKKSGQSSHYKITVLRDGLGRSAELRQNALPHRIDASFLLFCRFLLTDLSTDIMYKLVLIRHGESTWNKENRFTGWVDIDLTEQGNHEAQQAGLLLKEAGFSFDLAYTSVLKRAIRTLWHVQDQMDEMYLPVVHSWRLNERHYGALSGLNKAETAKKYGDEQVLIWRRSYDTPPPALDPSDERTAFNDPRYAKVPREQLPLTECLKDTVARVMPIWNESIAPAIKSGKRVLIAAHGNSMRALIKYLDGISDDDIVGLNVPNGVPLVYELDENLKPIKHYYLGDPEAIAKAQAAVAKQGKAG